MKHSLPVIQLKDRTFNFSIRVINFLKAIKYSKESEILKNQLLRAATSIGANYEEAQGAFSGDDFRYKISICLKEAREANYWLRIFKEGHLFGEDVGEINFLIRESEEIVKIFSAISKKINYRKAMVRDDG